MIIFSKAVNEEVHVHEVQVFKANSDRETLALKCLLISTKKLLLLSVDNFL